MLAKRIFARVFQRMLAAVQALSVSIFLIFLSSAGLPVHAGEPDALQESYQSGLESIIDQLATQFRHPASASLAALAWDARQAEFKGNELQALVLIFSNLPLIESGGNNEALLSLFEILLRLQAIGLAERLLDVAEQGSDVYGLAKLHLALARHHGEGGEWNAVLDYLGRIDIANDLDIADGDEANILYGAALQGLRQHRKAMNYYDRIKADSPHYRAAKLNSALAFLRQDWWTDAHLAIASALKAKASHGDAMTDRLHTVLGFSQIQYGFYRDARESFRKVRVDGPYAPRALLGLGVAAMHQQDLVGALNAFNHLRKRETADLSSLEAYLLSAYALDQLGQGRNASAAYSEALAYFQQYVQHCDSLIARLKTQAATASSRHELDKALPLIPREYETALRQLSLQSDILIQAETRLPNAAEIAKLRRQIDDAFLDRLSQAVAARKAVVESYSSQARFALARLYDSR